MNFRAPIRLSALAFAIASIAAAPVGFAQTTPPAGQADQDHRAHHPDTNAEAKPSPEAKPDGMGMGMMGQGGTMCGDMKQMMSMMQDMMTMMSAQSGMMASRVEADINKLKANLKITDAQSPHWNRFADTLRRMAKSMDEMHQQKMEAGAVATFPARVGRLEKSLLAQLNAVRALEEALQPLYASLNDEQKKLADDIKIGPMGMM